MSFIFLSFSPDDVGPDVHSLPHDAAYTLQSRSTMSHEEAQMRTSISYSTTCSLAHVSQAHDRILCAVHSDRLHPKLDHFAFHLGSAHGRGTGVD